jgi:3D-(3,5/4)-trihydroxycyclohexane-1,2-dione acylhydrolase (decyclizing)
MAKLSGAQALVEALVAEGIEYVFGLFGHGNVQLGDALFARRDKIKFITVRNEQAGVHAACAIARLTGKPAAVTTSVGPGATNLVTGAAMARVNRWPVLLLPGEVFAENVGPVLQEVETTFDVTANESLRPVSKFWTRVSRASRLRKTMREAFDAMMEPGNEGPATICLPMDSQAESFDFDREWLEKPRDRRYQRPSPDAAAVEDAARLLSQAKRPLIIAGGGVLRSRATAELASFAELLGAPVAPTQAGKGAILFEHPLNVFAVGPCGSSVGNHAAAKADVIIGVGTRYSDFTTASETAFARDATFVNINVCHFDVGKERALKLWGDAREGLNALSAALKKRGASKATGPWLDEVRAQREAWIRETDLWRTKEGAPLRQSRAIAIINDLADHKTTVISAAGTLPGDLQKLWRDKDPDGYICEYGYSTMGFEIAAGLGAKLACPDRHAVVLVGDLSFLMMNSELVTGAQLGIPFTVVVFDNKGGQSIRGLQRRSGFADYGMELWRGDGAEQDVDFAAIGKAMGCATHLAEDAPSLERALRDAQRETKRPTVIHLRLHKEDQMGGYGGWWDVPQPELDAQGQRRKEHDDYLTGKKKQVVR